MTVGDLIRRLQEMNPDDRVTVLQRKRRTHRLDDPEYEAVDVLDVQKGQRTTISNTYIKGDEPMGSAEFVTALRTR